MKLARNVDGSTLAKHLTQRWGHVLTGQTGSHMKLRTTEPAGHTIAIPAHRPLKTGTLHGVLKSVAEHRRRSLQEIAKGLR